MEKDMEFVQCMCNPQYLQYLYQREYFSKQKFRDYLIYLEYLREPEYSKYLVFPQALCILELLNHSPEFLDALKYKQLSDLLAMQQYLQWKNRR